MHLKIEETAVDGSTPVMNKLFCWHYCHWDVQMLITGFLISVYSCSEQWLSKCRFLYVQVCLDVCFLSFELIFWHFLEDRYIKVYLLKILPWDVWFRHWQFMKCVCKLQCNQSGGWLTWELDTLKIKVPVVSVVLLPSQKQAFRVCPVLLALACSGQIFVWTNWNEDSQGLGWSAVTNSECTDPSEAGELPVGMEPVAHDLLLPSKLLCKSWTLYPHRMWENGKTGPPKLISW